MEDTDHLLQTLLAQKPEETYNWLEQVKRGEIPIPIRGSNWWLCIAQEAQGWVYITNHNEGKADLSWARLALATYEYLDTTIDPDTPFASYQYSAMITQIFVLLDHGVVLGHPVLDPTALLEKCYRDIPTISLSEAQQIVLAYNENQGVQKASSVERTGEDVELECLDSSQQAQGYWISPVVSQTPEEYSRLARFCADLDTIAPLYEQGLLPPDPRFEYWWPLNELFDRLRAEEFERMRQRHLP